ncbi:MULTISPECIES: 5'-nucleotidase [Psychrobacter]|jgi:5'-nucleotidase|uniref:5'-nucleotidase n=2 Tax=root TaxID=1 RepID=A0ABT6IW68_9GAMM|nr:MULTISPECIES: 5'-nucleotidase [Psychrobacter]MBZ1393340.1 5'-nucleotidase [Psychrobacter pacificensis]MDE0844369.1 5'-nucleotidase [Psychrobacter pacificensis]MDH4905844.1 5'-nucleotidase [Psychrobacter pocilloporae]|tara:strand:+ start:2438 stop:3490 length:1053 start_codon:yes stop_codon:yes gene_type:complete
MAVDLTNTLIVAISATALFDLTESENHLLQLLQQRPDEAVKEFRDYMAKREDQPLDSGAGYPLIKALLNLNNYCNDCLSADLTTESPLVEVVIVSKSSPDTGIQVLNAIRDNGLNISRSAFVSGSPVAPYIKDFNVDLFLTTNREDAQQVADANICACAILDATPVNTYKLDTDQLRIAFDGDAVLFDDSGELLYKQKGLRAFHDREVKMRDLPIEKGPYAELLIKLSNLQERLPAGLQYSPIKIALVTARNAPADLRAIKTLREWGVNVDMAFFLGGLEKTAVLRTFAPHIFFDDSIKHIDAARRFIPTALVPYRSTSLLHGDSYLTNDKDATLLSFKPAVRPLFVVNH